MILRMVCLFMTFLVVTSPVFANDEDNKAEKKDEGKRREVHGIYYDLPEDYPIRKEKGAVQIAPLHEYVYMKVKKQDERIDKLEERIGKLEGEIGKLGARIEALGEQIKKLEEWIRKLVEQVSNKEEQVKEKND